MTMYIYNADVYCESCGDQMRADILHQAESAGVDIDVETADSGDLPMPHDGENDTDSPDHCGCREDCLEHIELDDGRRIGAILSTGLTEDGIEYVKESHGENPNPVTALWVDYFDIDIPEEDNDDDDDDHTDDEEW